MIDQQGGNWLIKISELCLKLLVIAPYFVSIFKGVSKKKKKKKKKKKQSWIDM